MAGQNINIVKLSDRNFASWESDFLALMTLRGYRDALTDTESTNNELALAILTLCVEDQHKPMLRTCTTAKQAFEKLQAIFKGKSIARQWDLRNEINTVKKSDAESITQYAARLQSLTQELELTGVDYQESDAVMNFLGGLPAEYSTERTVIRTTVKTPTFDNVLPILMTREQELERTEKANAMFTPAYGGYGAGRGRGGRFGDRGRGGYHQEYYASNHRCHKEQVHITEPLRKNITDIAIQLSKSNHTAAECNTSDHEAEECDQC